MASYAEIPPWRVHTMDPEAPYIGESAAGVIGDLASVPPDGDVLAGIYDECLQAQVFGSISCECGATLSASRERIAVEGLGVLFSLSGGDVHPNQNYGYNQNNSPFSMQRYIPCARFLITNGIGRIRFIGSDLTKIQALKGEGVEVIALG